MGVPLPMQIAMPSYQWLIAIQIVNEAGRPKIKVEYKGEEKTFYAEEISSMVLLKMKETAEAYLGTVSASSVLGRNGWAWSNFFSLF